MFLCGCGGLNTILSGGGGHGRNECNFRTQYGYVIRWSDLPIPIHLHEDIPPQAQENLNYAIDMWNEKWNYETGQGPLFEIMGSVVQEVPDKHGDGINLFYIDKEGVVTSDDGDTIGSGGGGSGSQSFNLLNSIRQGVTRLKNGFRGTLNDGDIVMNNVHFEFHYEKEHFDHSTYTHVPKLSTARTLASTLEHSFWMKWLKAFKSFINWVSFWKTTSPTRTPSAKKKRIPRGKIDFISLCLHELGHLVGLLHDEQNSKNIMYPHLNKGQIRRNLTETDTNRISCSYLE